MSGENKLRVGIIQTLTGTDKSDNLKRTEELLGQAAEDGAQLVVLPEMFTCPYELTAFPSYAESFPAGETFDFLSTWSRQLNIWIVGGSIPEKQHERLYNASYVFDDQGLVRGVHRKIHLFDVHFQSLSFQESAVFHPGTQPTLVNTPWGPMGVMICYDIRFPELSRWYALAGALMMAVPAAFNHITGPRHWEILFRTRAVDNQVFLFGASPAANPSSTYHAYGHSLIVDPMGQVLDMLEAQEGYLVREIDLAEVSRTRNILPLLRHRRPDLYVLMTELDNQVNIP